MFRANTDFNVSPSEPKDAYMPNNERAMHKLQTNPHWKLEGNSREIPAQLPNYPVSSYGGYMVNGSLMKSLYSTMVNNVYWNITSWLECGCLCSGWVLCHTIAVPIDMSIL